MGKRFLLILPVFALFFFLGQANAQKKGQETYSISLVKTAEVGKNIVKVGDRKVLTESVTVKKGDHIWQMFRERGLLQKRDLGQLLAVLRKLNTSLANLNLIYPGQKIIIPISLAPLQAPISVGQKRIEKEISLEDLKHLKLENYTVQEGDSLVKVIKGRFNIPQKKLHDEYLQLVKKLNPSIQDLNLIHPGEVVRLPIYSPQIVRAPILRPPSEKGPNAPGAQKGGIGKQLGELFIRMGLNWVSTGQHFIPLGSGGQVNLKADAFPLINLPSGDQIIVDLYDELPEKMGQLISTTWKSYAVVHLKKEDNLRNALDKILPLCQYPKIYKLGEPLEMEGDIKIQMTADWIIEKVAQSKDKKPKFMMITLTDPLNPGTPKEIRDFLKTLGIDVIDYPEPKQDQEAHLPGRDNLKTDGTMPALIEMALKLAGKHFSRDVQIHVFQPGKNDFNLVIKADFLLNIDGKDCIIDFSGLGSDVLALLKEQGFMVLSVANTRDPAVVLSKVLDLVGVKCNTEPHPFLVTKRVDTRNIKFTIPGVTFQDKDGQKIFATHLLLPDDLVGFLNQKGYQVLTLVLS